MRRSASRRCGSLAGGLLAAALACALAGACASGRSDEPPRRTVLAGPGAAVPPPEHALASDATCLQDERVDAYMRAVREAVCSRFEAPAGSGEDSFALIRFSIAPAGTLAWLEVVGTSDVALADRAVAALRGAAPFAAMPSTLTCLGREPLLAQFRPRAVDYAGGFCFEVGP